MNLVLDANALIALFQKERGADVVLELMDDPSNYCYIHSANLCEIYYDFHRTEGRDRAAEVLETVQLMELTVREDMDVEFIKAIGDCKATVRPMSFADCFCVALAGRVGGTIVTADKEFGAVQQAGICPVHFIR